MVGRRIVGYVVIETCDDYEQILGLDQRAGLPDGGILAWSDAARVRRILFPTRGAVRAAINRTHHYAEAFGIDNLPKRGFCKIKSIEKEA